MVNCVPLANGVPPDGLEYQFIVVPGAELAVKTADEPEHI